MKNTLWKIAASLLFMFVHINLVQAQIQKGLLTKEKLISSEISPKEKHQYKVKLGKDQFAFLKLMQKGVDMKITTYNPKGEKLEEFDSPNGKNGPEFITLISSNKGEYIIEVYPFDEKEPSGIYTLGIQTIKSKAVTANEKVDELFTVWNGKDTPGAAVAVVKDGVIVHKNGYGMANLEYDIPISSASIFHIASVSKQFTVFSILLLEAQGKLSLNDDIRKHIPEVPDFGKTITLRHLASHTSGLRDQWNLLAMAGWRLDDVITKEHVLKLVSNQKDLNFTPGDEYLYCNTGFTLLAEVVSRVSGKSFAEFTKTNIFQPLKMYNTLFYDDHEKIVKNRTYSYHSDSTGYKKSVLSYANVGATSLFTTVEDLSLWSLNFSSPSIGNVDLINTMNTQAVLNNGETVGGALGQFVGKYKGLNEIQHGGADAGYRSYLTRFPDQNFSAIVFSNAASFNAGAMVYKIVDIYLEDKLEIKEEPKKTEDLATGISIDQSILDSYVGDFELQPGFIISITSENGKLFGRATGQPKLSLEPVSVNEFFVSEANATITFVDADDKIDLIKLHQGGQIMDASRVVPFDTDSVLLSDFIGHYYSEELSTGYHFSVIDEKLIAQHSRLSDIELIPVKKDTFNGKVWFFAQVEFQRDANGSISGCKVSSGRVRNLWFQKME